MEDKIIAAIIIKGLGVDEFGLQQYVWATKKQAEKLLEAQYDEERNKFVFILGDEGIRPCDIVRIKFVKVKEAVKWPALKRYVIDELYLEAENEAKNSIEINEEGRKRLNGLYNEHNNHLI